MPVSERRNPTAITQAAKAEMNNATISATIPGRKLATWLSNRLVDSVNACSALSHIVDSFLFDHHGLKRSGHRQRETRYGLVASKAWHSRSSRCSAALAAAFCISSAYDASHPKYSGVMARNR